MTCARRIWGVLGFKFRKGGGCISANRRLAPIVVALSQRRKVILTEAQTCFPTNSRSRFPIKMRGPERHQNCPTTATLTKHCAEDHTAILPPLEPFLGIEELTPRETGTTSEIIGRDLDPRGFRIPQTIQTQPLQTIETGNSPVDNSSLESEGQITHSTPR